MDGKKLKELRIKKGITTYNLQKGGISQGTYNSIENDGNYTQVSLKKYLNLIYSYGK